MYISGFVIYVRLLQNYGLTYTVSLCTYGQLPRAILFQQCAEGFPAPSTASRLSRLPEASCSCMDYSTRIPRIQLIKGQVMSPFLMRIYAGQESLVSNWSEEGQVMSPFLMWIYAGMFFSMIIKMDILCQSLQNSEFFFFEFFFCLRVSLQKFNFSHGVPKIRIS